MNDVNKNSNFPEPYNGFYYYFFNKPKTVKDIFTVNIYKDGELVKTYADAVSLTLRSFNGRDYWVISTVCHPHLRYECDRFTIEAF